MSVPDKSAALVVNLAIIFAAIVGVTGQPVQIGLKDITYSDD